MDKKYEIIKLKKTNTVNSITSKQSGSYT